MCIAKGKGVGQSGPGFEAADASAANAPAADSAFRGVVGGRNVTLLEEKAVGTPVITQAEQEFLQTSQRRHGLVVNTWRGLNPAIELVNTMAAVRWHILKQLAYLV